MKYLLYRTLKKNLKILENLKNINSGIQSQFVILLITYLCNSKCKTCHIWKFYKKFPNLLKMELKSEDYKKLFDELKSNLVLTIFSGGEPLLKRDAVKIITYAFNKTSMLEAWVPTNAVNVKYTYEIIKKIIKSIPPYKSLSIIISLDGIYSLHDKIRGVNGNFKNAINLWKKLNKLSLNYKNLNVYLTYTISNFNVGNLKKFYEKLTKILNEDLRGKIGLTLAYEAEAYFGNVKKVKIRKEKYGELKKDILFYLKEVCKGNAFSRYYAKKILKSIVDKNLLQDKLRWSSITITPFGDVKPCILSSTVLGNIKKTPLKEIVNSVEARMYIKKEKVNERWELAKWNCIVNYQLNLLFKIFYEGLELLRHII